MFEKELPTSVMDFQFHLLIHLVNKVELVGVVYSHWMFFLERYMEKLKGFVGKREKLEGYILDGYVSYKSFYYASEHIKQIYNTLGAVIWDDERDEDKSEGELLKMNGKKCVIKSMCKIIICQITTK